MESIAWPLILLLVGILLVMLEVLVPSGGLIGILASVALIASVVMAFSHSLVAGVMILLVDLLLIPVVLVLAFKWWPHTPLGKLILAKRPESEDEVLPDTEAYRRREWMVGKIGITRCPLLPGGDVLIEGREYDAVSDGMAIDTGQPIKVVAVRTQRLVVRPLTRKELAEQAGDGGADILSTPIDALGIDSLEDPLA